MEKKDNYFSASGLKYRGWTDALIKRFLPEHDKECPNPHYRHAAPMRLYSADRVERIEESQAFKEAVEKSSKRKESAKKAVETKKQQAMNYALTVDISIPKMTLKELFEFACEHFNNRQRGRAERSGNWDYELVFPEFCSFEFLSRISVNFLRHECSEYEEHLEELYGVTGKQAAYETIKRRVNEAIYNMYPELAIN